MNLKPLPLVALALLLGTAPATQPTAATESRADRILRSFRTPNDGRVLVASHRGDWHNYPENSIAALQAAVDLGADILETDFRKTRDGHFIVIHDKTLDRTTTGSGKVSDKTLAEIRLLRLKDINGKPTNETIPTLDDLVAAFRGKALIYFDKTDDCLDDVYAHLQRLNFTDHALFFGRRPESELRARYGSIVDNLVYIPKVADELPAPDKYITSFATALHPACFIVEFAHGDDRALKNIGLVRAAGARAWVSPLFDGSISGGKTDTAALTDPDANWGYLIDQGVTVFCTDRPGELLTYLRRRSLHE